MSDFFGTYQHRLDDKWRLTLPARYRDQLTRSPMKLTLGQDDCLYLFTPEGFSDFARDAINAPITDRAARAYQRVLFANTEELTADRLGRITISAHLREKAGLVKDVVITGSGSRMEIWDAAVWNAYETKVEPVYRQPERGILNPD